MLKHLLYLLIIALTTFIFSCNKEKLKAPASSNFIIQNPTVTTSNVILSNKITDIWYYVDGQFLGAYPLGNIMPIIGSNKTDIILYAGIKNNGISETRQPYTFYAPYTLSNFDLEQGKTYTISPNFNYITTANTSVFDNFDGNVVGSLYKSIGDSSYTTITDPLKVKGGIGKSVFMGMSDAKPTAMMVSSIPLYGIPNNGAAVYLELDYKCNQPITVGVIGGGSDVRTAITLNATSNWNTIYIQLSAVLTTPPTYNTQEIFVKAVKQTDNPEIYLDNIKLVY